ncbi:unnamed protein product [Phytophthora fragariaefolia]|uniref:Unnamed protein product n=1 Tax=Phytophthora fragariaefolia TaxID=1490495 RepID=A0A9W7D441_9STRA|nr:unnamed protein product [Phytophthora fragariaefolia]
MSWCACPDTSQGFNRESNQEDVEIKLEPGIDVPAVSGSQQTQLREEGSTEGQSTGRSSDRGEATTVKTVVTSSNPTPSVSTKKKSRSSRKKLKVPGSDAGDRGDAAIIAEDQLEDAFYRNGLAAFMKEDPVMKIVRPTKLIGSALLGPVTTPPTMNHKLDAAKTMLHLLKEAGYAPRAFDAHELFDLELKTIEGSLQNLFDKLAPLVGTASTGGTEKLMVTQAAERMTGSSPYASAHASVTSEMGSETSGSVYQERMPLGPAGEAMLQARRATFKEEQSSNKTTGASTRDQDRPSRMQTFFDAAMDRFLKEQHTTETRSATTARKTPEIQDVDMELVGIKVTLAGSLVYYFDAWVGAQSGQTAILGMDFMVPAGIRLDLADGSLFLPDEVKIQLSGRRQLYRVNSQLVTLDQPLEVPEAEAIEIPIRSGPSPNSKLWVTRGPSWVPTVVKGLGRTRYLRLTNVSEAKVILQRDVKLGIWLAPDAVPRLQGFVSVGKRRYSEWQNLAFEATTDLQQAPKDAEQPADPMVERPQYLTPTQIARRPMLDPKPVVSAIARRDVLSTGKPPEIVQEERLHDRDAGPPTEMLGEPAIPSTQSDHRIDTTPTRDPTIATSEHPALKSEVAEEERICHHEGGDLFAEDVEQDMALLREVVSTTDEITIEDIQAGDPESNTPEEIYRLRRIIWRRKHLLIGKGNALLLAALGAVCDIDVGGAAPVAQRVRPVAPQF